MKTKIRILSILLLATTYLSAQITFDFSRKTEFDMQELQGSIKPVKVGDFVILKIENVNTFRYQVNVSGKSIDYATPVPSELQMLFRLPSDGLNQSSYLAQQGAGDTEGALNSMKSMEKEVGQKVNNKKTEIANDILNKKSNGTIQKKKDDLNDLQSLEKTMQALTATCERYVTLAKAVASIKFDRMTLINLSKQKWSNYQTLQIQMPLIPTEAQMRQDYLDFVSLYHSVESLYKKAIISAGFLNDNEKVNSIEEALKRIEEGYEKIDEGSFMTLIGDVVILNRALKNKENFVAVSPPIQMDGDFMELEIRIGPTQVHDLLPYEQAHNFKIEIPGKGGWKADFSIGPTLSFGKNALDHSFFLNRSVTRDSTGVISGLDSIGTLTQQSITDDLRPGVAAMVHAHWRSGKAASLGWMLGVGAGFTSISDANFSLYTGPTIVFGKRQKFMLSGGWSFHRVARLNEAYTLGRRYHIDDFTEEVTVDVFKPSGFISLSYALGTRTEIR